MKKIILLAMLLFVAYFHAQTLNATTTENYIYAKTCLDADCIKKTETIQYFNGLGNPKQTISIKASPSGKDVVGYLEYDQFGRQVNDYLPVPQAGTQNGAIYVSPLSNAPSVYGSEKIFSEKNLEKSPLGRVNQISPLGNTWSQHPITFGYSANLSGEVKKFVVTTSWLEGRTNSQITVSTPYTANQLTKTMVTDADTNTTTEFQNGDGQTILVRKNDGTQDTDTYYLYNEYGQLAAVIPPLAVKATWNETTLNTLCYQYRYDGMGKLVEKKLPGKGWEYLIYDQQDRVIMTQDASLRAYENTFGTIGWMFSKYDKLGRVVYSGFFPSTESRESLQNKVNNLTVNAENNEARSTGSFMANGIEVYYSQNAFPSGNMTVLAVNYYDSYPSYSFNPAFPASVLGQEVITDSPTASVNTKTLPTLSLVRNIEDTGWTKNYVYYDKKSRGIAAYSINYLGGYTRSETELDFAGVTRQTKVYHKRLSSDTEKVITQTFEYDAQNRLKVHKHKVDGNPQEEILAQNEYNELSQLSNKKVGNNLQSIDYSYNIRGALTQVNDPAALGTKLFGYKLKYFNPQNTTASTGKYNGNITEVTWKTASDQVLRQYNYQYDALNRLKKGIYSEPDASVPQNGLFDETIGYDVNGNITSLQRNGKSSSGTAQLIDNLTYNYTGNRLNTVTDIAGNYSGYPDTSGTLISYDENGNMKDHKDKGILQIDYNFLNLPDYIRFDKGLQTRTGIINENTIYTYRADGTKVKKVYNYTPFDPLGTATELTSDITEYLDGFQYETTTSKKGAGPLVLKFIPTAEGYYNFENNKYIYSYTDHLGNVRVSYSRSSAGSAEVLEENNYYPFGLKHQGYTFLTGNPAYNYQYNGKELQKETGWNDYGARMYMADIGRWGVIDPLAETSRRFTPYNYAFNNPISFIDPDGRRAMSPAEKDPSSMGFGNGMLSYYASGGKGTRANIMAFSGQQDYSLGGVYDAKPWTGSGGGNSAMSDPTPRSSKGPGVIERFISWLFGGKKKAGRLEVGQVERVQQTALFGLIRNANVNANGESPLEQYRSWRDYPLYNEGENWLDRFARNVNSSHMEILQDEGSGGGLMFGGFGNDIALAEEISMTSKISAEARLQGFKSLNSGIDPAITANYLEQMMNGTFNKTIGVAGFEWEGKFYLNDGNHRMNSAIQYKILTGDYKYMDILMKNAKFDNANPINYGKVYRFPVKPTR